ncbi:MAG: MFS transporter [Endomicrobium sp.]|jgi:MFS family permease|nr:MFS transporter [Endomicrobium sp.]
MITKKYVRKLVLFSVLNSFLLTFVFCDFVYAKNVKKLDNIEKMVENSMLIDSSYYDSNTLIIHILDSHSDYEAQRKISDIIDFYDKKKQIEKIFVEGAPLGKVNLNLFKSIDENLKKSILDKMLSEAQIGACEYYASYNNRDILFGMEDNDLYNKNLRLIQNMLSLYKESEAFFKNISEKIEVLKKIHMSGSFFDIDKAIEEENINSYSKIKAFLKKDDSFDETLYKDFFTYLYSKEQREKIDYKSAIKEISSLNKYLNSKMSYGKYMRVSDLISNSDDKNSLAEAYKIITKNAPDAEKFFPLIMEIFRINYVNLNLNPYDVYLQKQSLKKHIVERFASKEEKDIMYLADMVESLKQIYSLGITRTDLLNFINTRNNIKEISAKYMNIAESNTLVYLAENKITDLIYFNNLQRDLIFFNAVKDAINSEKSGKIGSAGISGINDFSNVFVVVTGGFHLEFTDFLRKNKISYLSIAPKIEKKSDRTQYLDAINFPGRIGSKNITFEHSAFAPPLLNAVTSNENEPLKGKIIKNIIQAWVSTAQESGVSKEDVYADMLDWLIKNGISESDIKNIEELSFLAAMLQEQRIKAEEKNVEKQEPQTKAPNISETNAKPEKKSIFTKIKGNLKAKFLRWNFPEIAAANAVFKSAKSYQELVNIIRNLKKVNTIEFDIKREGSDFYIECSKGFKVSIDEALNIVEKFAKKKSKTNIILNFDKSIDSDSGRILGFTLKIKNKFIIISSNKEFAASVDSAVYKNVSMVYKMPSGLSAEDALEEIENITAAGIFGLHIDKSIFDSVGVYLFSIKHHGKYLDLYIQDGKVDEQYSDFIFEGRGKTILISSEPATHLEQKKRSLAAHRNISAALFIHLVVGFEFFASFRNVYITKELGYEASYLSIILGLCALLAVMGSLISNYLSNLFGKRNVLMGNLFLHCAGDALLLFAGGSPILLGFALGVPAMAAAGIGALFIPFLYSSLKTIGKEDNFESVYGKIRSKFWIGFAISVLLGSLLAEVVTMTFVIAMSSILITFLSIYSLIMTKSIADNRQEEKTKEEKQFSNLKESKKIWNAVKTVLTTKNLNTMVIINFIIDSGLFVFLDLGMQLMLHNEGNGLRTLAIGIVVFSASLMQSVASKFVSKVSSFVNNYSRRIVYFTSLTALVAGFLVFHNFFFLIAFYLLASFWQGTSSVVEPAKVEKTLSDNISPYWFSAKIVINSVLAAVVELIIALLLFNNFAYATILMLMMAAITVFSAILSSSFSKRKNQKDFNELPNIMLTNRMLSAA